MIMVMDGWIPRGMTWLKGFFKAAYSLDFVRSIYAIPMPLGGHPSLHNEAQG